MFRLNFKRYMPIEVAEYIERSAMKTNSSMDSFIGRNKHD